jgi:prepilin-type N-terminal cleavage/methylation domain-containing protein
MKPPLKQSIKAFTLIELSIVLVIIGLLAGGIILGSNLIKIAEIRSAIKQIEGIQTGVNAFRLKYNCLPGDCVNATNLGFETRTGASGHGNGNNLYENCSPASSYYLQGCETLLFWSDLSDAGLIEGNFTTATDANNVITPTNRQQYFPLSKMGSGYFMVYNSTNVTFPWAGQYQNYLGQYQNYLTLIDFSGTMDASGATFLPSIPPTQAFAIDSKIDDGKPISGKVLGGVNQSTEGFYPGLYPGAPGASVDDTDCTLDADRYNTIPPYAETKLCILNFKM